MKKSLYQYLQWIVACSLVEQVMSAREGVGEFRTCKATETSVLDTNNNQMILTMRSKGMTMTIGDPTTGKNRVEVEEGDFPEEEDALEGGEDISQILFTPTNKTLNKKVEMAKQMPQAKLLLYPNRHLLLVISQVEEVLEVVVEVVAVEGLLMEEEVEQVERRLLI